MLARSHLVQQVARAWGDGHTRRKGSTVHLAVDTRGPVVARLVTPANEQERAQVAALAENVHPAPGETGEVAGLEQGYTGAHPAHDAEAQGIRVEVGCPAPRAAGCCCRAAVWGHAGLAGWPAFGAWRAIMNACPQPLVGRHFLAFALWMLKRFIGFMLKSA